MKKRLSVPAVLLAMALSAFAPATAAAAQPSATDATVTARDNCNVGGAAALVLVVAGLCDVVEVNDSLNNLLQNADIHVLENILNNSPILNDLTITVTENDILNNNDVLTGIEVTVIDLGGFNVPVVFILPVTP